jgi:hypothetical protein
LRTAVARPGTWLILVSRRVSSCRVSRRSCFIGGRIRGSGVRLFAPSGRGFGFGSPERRQLQIPFRGGCRRGDGNIATNFVEAQHFDGDDPRAVLQIRESVNSLFIGGGGKFLFALRRSYHCAGDRQSTGFNTALILRGRERGDGCALRQENAENKYTTHCLFGDTITREVTCKGVKYRKPSAISRAKEPW